MINNIEAFSLQRAGLATLTFKPLPEIPFPIHWVSTATARSGMHHILTFLKRNGVLENKNTQILVPQGLCCSFLQLLRKHAAPTLNPQERIRVAIPHHQYGFPQNMDEVLDYADRRGITVIEDCAHLFEGYYRGKRLGTLSFAAIFSLSKIFPCICGGGLATGSEELYQQALESQRALHKPWISGLLHGARYLNSRNGTLTQTLAQTLTTMSYARVEDAQIMGTFAKHIVLEDLRNGALARRADNYRHLLRRFENRPYFQGLEHEGVCPYLVPLFAPQRRAQAISDALKQGNIASETLHFDVNRNIFNPHFVECVSIPVHQGLSAAQMERICEVIEKTDE